MKRSTKFMIAGLSVIALALALIAAAIVTSHATDPLDGVMYWPSYHQGQQAVMAQTNDPESVRFRDLYFNKHNGAQYLCGDVNARNRMGGYVGFVPFWVLLSDARPEDSLVEIGTNPAFMDIAENCQPTHSAR